MELEKLSQELISNLRTSIFITSLPACVVELVYNSLDAHATTVDVAVSSRQWSARISDNGDGMQEADLKRLGERYLTSKITSSDGPASRTYGFRGEALASIADVSLVEIISRHRTSSQTYSTVLRGGQQLHFGLAKPHQQRVAPGTSVQVRDLFYKWPVRRKSAPLNPIDQLKRALQRIVLIHTGTCLRLVDLDDPTNKSAINVTGCSDYPERWAQLWGKSLLAKTVKVEHSFDLGHANGFFSCAASESKQYQFIYVNNDLSQDDRLYHIVNHAFNNSSFSRLKESDTWKRYISPSPSPSKRKKLDSPEAARQQHDRHPVYLLVFELQSGDGFPGLAARTRPMSVKTEEKLMSTIKHLAINFLEAQGLKNRPTIAPAKDAKSPKVDRLDRRESALPRHDHPRFAEVIVHPEASDGGADAIDWTDPITGCKDILDPRTGHSRPQHTLEEQVIDHESSTPLGIDRRRLRSTRQPNSSQPEWLTAALAQHQDQPHIACVHEQAIPSIDQTCHHDFHPTTKRLLGGISRPDLDAAVFVSQVDEKFLLCRITAGNDTSLVLIDQHAADERVRVESFLSSYCDQVQAGKVDVEEFKEPQAVLLARAEGVQLASGETRAVFAKWGIGVESEDVAVCEEDYCQVWITHVPAVVGKRFRSEPRLIQDLINRFLAQLIEHPQRAQTTQIRHWAALLPDIPRPIFDLINSKACRGAIMFNDVLSPEQSIRLLEQLRATEFPFQCAHGRPSLVALPLSVQKEEEKKVHWDRL